MRFRHAFTLLCCAAIVGLARVETTLADLTGAESDLRIDVGGRQIDVPLPAGFVELTADRQPEYAAEYAAVPDGNVQYAVLIPAASVPLASETPLLPYARKFSVQTTDALAQTSTDQVEFENFTVYLRQTRQHQLDAGIEVLPVHADEVDRLAYSMLFGSSDEKESAVDSGAGTRTAVTLTVLHVGSRVLFLYAVGSAGDLDWTRRESTAWADAIAAANVDPAGSAAASPDDRPQFFWTALALAIVIALIAARRRLVKLPKDVD